MRLPDPFTPNLKVDLLPEISQPPRMLSPITPPLAAANLLTDLDSFLQTRQPFSLLIELRARLTNADGSPRVALINALVLHVGMAGIAAQQSGQQTPAALAHSAPMELYQRLLTELSSESRYVLLNGIANQLRYPNNHTHYFSYAQPPSLIPTHTHHPNPSLSLIPSSLPSLQHSCVMLHLFAESTDERVQELITRVLVSGSLCTGRTHGGCSSPSSSSSRTRGTRSGRRTSRAARRRLSGCLRASRDRAWRRAAAGRSRRRRSRPRAKQRMNEEKGAAKREEDQKRDDMVAAAAAGVLLSRAPLRVRLYIATALLWGWHRDGLGKGVGVGGCESRLRCALCGQRRDERDGVCGWAGGRCGCRNC